MCVDVCIDVSLWLWVFGSSGKLLEKLGTFRWCTLHRPKQTRSPPEERWRGELHAAFWNTECSIDISCTQFVYTNIHEIFLLEGDVFHIHSDHRWINAELSEYTNSQITGNYRINELRMNVTGTRCYLCHPRCLLFCSIKCIKLTCTFNKIKQFLSLWK